MDKVGCSWEPYPPLTFGDQCSFVVMPTAATFNFEIPKDQGPVLNVMGLPGDRHDCNVKCRQS
ncbi:hypothetical protein ABZ362_32780 [Streptomyces sp. NPDC005951]|uniref:hypothetical protein n=1 Tax=Streptomyces sp. NPDC005951 TaxID=3154573 RepID=UPI0033D09F09